MKISKKWIGIQEMFIGLDWDKWFFLPIGWKEVLALLWKEVKQHKTIRIGGWHLRDKQILYGQDWRRTFLGQDSNETAPITGSEFQSIHLEDINVLPIKMNMQRHLKSKTAHNLICWNQKGPFFKRYLFKFNIKLVFFWYIM